MNFELAGYTITNGIRIDSDSNTIITVNISVKISDCPYPGLFQQNNENITLVVPGNLIPEDLFSLLPTLITDWITLNYPNT